MNYEITGFASGDMVEEIGTGRKGRISLGTIGSPTVMFVDGKMPLIKDFPNLSELRLIERAGEDAPPALIPERWVV
jgi:hypothetical protein